MTAKVIKPTEVYYEVRFPFSFIFYPEDDRWIGHCLETDTVAEGTTPARAVRNLKHALELQIEDALGKKDIGVIYNPAPREYWRLLPQAISMAASRRYKSLTELLDRLGDRVKRIMRQEGNRGGP